jgi:hypothetical protein
MRILSNKETPTLPITRTDIQLEGKWIQTLAHEQFLFADEANADKILMLRSFALSSSWMVGIGVVSLMQCSLIMLITASAFTLAEFGACVW